MSVNFFSVYLKCIFHTFHNNKNIFCRSSSRLEWTVSQWGGYLESAKQLRCWMEAVEREVCAPLTPQPGPREKASQLERLRALLADLEDHQVALSSLEEKARELFKKTGDAGFNHGARTQLQVQFDDLTALVEVYCSLYLVKNLDTPERTNLLH